jgi:hypothetical protein
MEVLRTGKKSVFKLIKSSSAELSDLSELKDPDFESSICVARKVMAKTENYTSHELVYIAYHP